MPAVFVLQHGYEWCGRDEVKFIGVYATESDALAAIERLKLQPGFRDWPEGFTIDRYELGVDHWVEGFVTLVRVLVPTRGDAGRYQLTEAVWRPGDLYRLSVIDEPETALFAQGELVRVEERSVPGYGDRALVVTERVQPGI